MKEQAVRALRATLDEITVKLSCAESFMDGDDPEMALTFLKDIHGLSYVGPNDYRELKQA